MDFGPSKQFLINIYVLESIVSACTFKCQFHEQGCTTNVPITGDVEHQVNCSFRNVQCASFGFKECTKESKLKEFIPHLSKEHSVSIRENNLVKGNVFTSDYLVFSTTDRFIDGVLTFDNKMFLLNFKILGSGNNRKLCDLTQEEKNSLRCSWWISVLSGDREDAKNYTCKITLTSSSNSCRTSSCSLSSEGPVTTLRELNKPLLTTSLGNIVGKFYPFVDDKCFAVPEIQYKIHAFIYKNCCLSSERPVTTLRELNKPLVTTSLGNILDEFCPVLEEDVNFGVPKIQYKIDAFIYKKLKTERSVTNRSKSVPTGHVDKEKGDNLYSAGVVRLMKVSFLTVIMVLILLY